MTLNKAFVRKSFDVGLHGYCSHLYQYHSYKEEKVRHKVYENTQVKYFEKRQSENPSRYTMYTVVALKHTTIPTGKKSPT